MTGMSRFPRHRASRRWRATAVQAGQARRRRRSNVAAAPQASEPGDAGRRRRRRRGNGCLGQSVDAHSPDPNARAAAGIRPSPVAGKRRGRGVRRPWQGTLPTPPQHSSNSNRSEMPRRPPSFDQRMEPHAAKPAHAQEGNGLHAHSQERPPSPCRAHPVGQEGWRYGSFRSP